MNICILPVRKDFQPESQRITYPAHNDDYGVEQDFHRYLLAHDELTVEDPETADWHYLPIYWCRYQLNHDYGKTGLGELQKEVNRCIIDDRRTFIIYGYSRGPLVDLGRTVAFLVSRRTDYGIDIPLLCAPHEVPFYYRIPILEPSKRYLASFVGRLSTHRIRQEMAAQLGDRSDVFILDGNQGTDFFVRKMLESYIALCPRGAGGGSYRFFEAMQLGTIPFLIGDMDVRPFQKFIDWDKASFFSNTISEVEKKLASLKESDLSRMGKCAAELWKEELTYQKWCRYVIRELEEL